MQDSKVEEINPDLKVAIYDLENQLENENLEMQNSSFKGEPEKNPEMQNESNNEYFNFDLSPCSESSFNINETEKEKHLNEKLFKVKQQLEKYITTSEDAILEKERKN